MNKMNYVAGMTNKSSSSSKKDKNDDHKLEAEEWQKFVESTGFHRFNTVDRSLSNQNNEVNDIDQYEQRCINIVRQHMNLRNYLNKLYDDKISKVFKESQLDNNKNAVDMVGVNKPNSKELIDHQRQTYEKYEQIKEELNNLMNQRVPLCDQFKALQSEIDNLRKKRTNLLEIFNQTDNDIRAKTSKICFRSNNNQLIAMIFNHDGCLQNFLIENKENATKEDFWNDLSEKICN